MEKREKLRDLAMMLESAYLGDRGLKPDSREFNAAVTELTHHVKAFIRLRRWPWQTKYNRTIEQAYNEFLEAVPDGKIIDGQKLVHPRNFSELKARKLGVFIELL